MTPLRRLLSAVVAVIAAATVTLVALNLPNAIVTPPDDRYICRGTHYYALQATANSSYVLDVKNGYLENGAEIQLWTWVGGANQIWFFDGAMVRTLLNGKCLDRMNVTDVDDPNYGHVHLWDCQIWNPNQYWSVTTNNEKEKPFQLVHASGDCLMPITTRENGGIVKTMPCDEKETWQAEARS